MLCRLTFNLSCGETTESKIVYPKLLETGTFLIIQPSSPLTPIVEYPLLVRDNAYKYYVYLLGLKTPFQK